MKERPILFSAPTVRAILDGQKTQTRRIVKPQPYITKNEVKCWGPPTDGKKYLPNGPRSATGGVLWSFTDLIGRYCPYGVPGDRLWVRETWAAPGWDDSRISEIDHRASLVYRADDPEKHEDDGTWHPSIHMPRWASRITLEITGVRVERLRNISEEDAIAEGVENIAPNQWRDYEDGRTVICPCGSFRTLWTKINGRESWDANPWVWVVEFRRLPPNGKEIEA